MMAQSQIKVSRMRSINHFICKRNEIDISMCRILLEILSYKQDDSMVSVKVETPTESTIIELSKISHLLIREDNPLVLYAFRIILSVNTNCYTNDDANLPDYKKRAIGSFASIMKHMKLSDLAILAGFCGTMITEIPELYPETILRGKVIRSIIDSELDDFFRDDFDSVLSAMSQYQNRRLSSAHVPPPPISQFMGSPFNSPLNSPR